MSNDEALLRVIAKALGDTAPVRSFRDNLEALVQKEGSGRAAARAIGVDEAQVRRWRKGQTAPKADSVSKLETAARAARVKSGDPAPADFTLKAKDRNDTRRKERTITGKQLQLKPEALRRMKEAYVSGSDAGAVREFKDAVGDDFYRAYLDYDGDGIDYFGNGDYGGTVQ